jgi:hypothetical protein
MRRGLGRSKQIMKAPEAKQNKERDDCDRSASALGAHCHRVRSRGCGASIHLQATIKLIAGIRRVVCEGRLRGLQIHFVNACNIRSRANS